MNGIFISYRRQDSQGFAGRLTDDLNEIFGEEQVFRDVDIIPGSDFSQAIRSAIASCDTLLVVIGKHWLDVRDASGEKRIYDPEDWVRLEIEAGLAGTKLILPLLVGGAAMPDESELPPSIAELSRRQALTLSDRRWRKDLQELQDFLLQHVPSLHTALAAQAAKHKDQKESEEGRQERDVEAFRRLGEQLAEELKQRRPVSTYHQGRPPWLLSLALKLLKKALGLGVFLLIVYFVIETYGDASARAVLRDFEAFIAGLLKKILSYFS